MADVVVVGGGPAGSTCALLLARAGVAVTLVEQQRFPRRKVCGEYLGAGAVATLDALGLRHTTQSAARSLRGVRLVLRATEALELDFPLPALACERAVLDALLLDAARQAGVEVMRARAEDVVVDAGRIRGVVVRDALGERQTLMARFTVGADGVGSLVARKLGLARRARARRRFALGGHYGMARLDDYVEMFVGTDAYVAFNPLDDQRCNAMLVVDERSVAAWAGAIDAEITRKTSALTGGRRPMVRAQRIGARVSIGPLAFEVTDVIRPGVLLAGDAAGFVDPFTGQGVLLALHGGSAASAAILRALHRRESERHALARYAAARVREFNARRRLGWLVDRLVDVPFLARRGAARLGRRPELAAMLLGAVGGDASPECALGPSFLRKLLL